MNLSRNRSIVFILATGGLLTLVMILLAVRPIRAAGPWYVAPGGDDGNDCLSPVAPCATINGAIGKASSGDTIFVAIGTYTGTGDQVVLLDKDATLSGGWDDSFTEQNGTSTIDGEEARRGITVNDRVTPIIIERFTVQNGFAGQGGGISFNGYNTVILNHSTVSGNTASYQGGGILISGGYANTVTMSNCTVSGNTAPWYGGINNYSTLILNNSTVSGNTAEHTGGGIGNHFETLTLNNSTVSGNAALWSGGISGGGPVTLQNSILANNMADTAPDCDTDVDSLGYNLVGNTSGCTLSPGTGDLTDVDADLGLLLGPSSAPSYHPLLLGSPAIDAGNPAGCTDHLGDPLDTDQRGAPRVGRCDIGAYEYTTPGAADSIFAFEGTPQRTPPFSTFWTSLHALVLDGIGSPVPDVTVTFSGPVSGASGAFADSGASTTSSVTSESGVAIAAPFTANGLEGSYTVTAAVGGVISPANFLLANIGWYVAPGGDNSNNCQTPTTPCATINGPLGKAGFVAGDTVLVATGIYTGTGGEVVLLDERVRLLGGWHDTFTAQSGTSTIDGEGSRRDITVSSGVTSVIERFTILSNPAGQEGGIYNDGTLTLNNSTVSGNSTSWLSTYTAGGIYNAGILTLNNCTVSSNTGSNAGGILNDEDGIVSLNDTTVRGNTGPGIENRRILIANNSTISGNTTGWYGGGIRNSGTLTLNSSTVSGNTAGQNGGGIFNHGDGTATLQNTILAGNMASGSGPDCSGEIDSSGYNLVGDPTDCTFTATNGDLIGMDSSLGPLEGSPGYHPLKFTSPAIDSGNPAGCTDHLGNPLTTDQRGTPRPLDGDGDSEAICDIGSYEFDPDENPLTAVYLPVILRNY